MCAIVLNKNHNITGLYLNILYAIFFLKNEDMYFLILQPNIIISTFLLSHTHFLTIFFLSFKTHGMEKLSAKPTNQDRSGMCVSFKLEIYQRFYHSYMTGA